LALLTIFTFIHVIRPIIIQVPGTKTIAYLQAAE